MKYIILIFLIGCTEKNNNDRTNWIVPVKYCLDVCNINTFKSFHSKGDSWGTSSSSMNGLSQNAIFDRVEKYCKEFYAEEKCCEFNYQHLDQKSIIPIHGWEYGPCTDRGKGTSP